MGGMTEGLDESGRYREGAESLGETLASSDAGRSHDRAGLVRTRAQRPVGEEQKSG